MSNRPEDLEPVTRSMRDEFHRRCQMSMIAVRDTQTLRTFDEQQHLYMQGRMLGGAIVTNAKPGESAHNFGMAFDICFDGRTLSECYPPHDDPRWQRVGEIGEAVGLTWGGRWKSIKDYPHFERPGWKALVTQIPQVKGA